MTWSDPLSLCRQLDYIYGTSLALQAGYASVKSPVRSAIAHLQDASYESHLRTLLTRRLFTCSRQGSLARIKDAMPFVR